MVVVGTVVVVVVVVGGVGGGAQATATSAREVNPIANNPRTDVVPIALPPCRLGPSRPSRTGPRGCGPTVHSNEAMVAVRPPRHKHHLRMARYDWGLIVSATGVEGPLDPVAAPSTNSPKGM